MLLIKISFENPLKCVYPQVTLINRGRIQYVKSLFGNNFNLKRPPFENTLFVSLGFVFKWDAYDVCIAVEFVLAEVLIRLMNSHLLAFMIQNKVPFVE